VPGLRVSYNVCNLMDPKYTFLSILTSDDYLSGLLVLAYSLQKTGTTLPLLVLLTPNISSKTFLTLITGAPDSSRSFLIRSAFIFVIIFQLSLFFPLLPFLLSLLSLLLLLVFDFPFPSSIASRIKPRT